MPGVEIEHGEPTIARFRFDRRTMSAETLIRRVTERYAVNDISIEEPELEVDHPPHLPRRVLRSRPPGPSEA